MDFIKKHRSVFCLLVSLVLFLFGSAFGVIVAYIFAKAKYGYDFQTSYKLLSYIANIYSTQVAENGELIKDIISEFFASNKTMFEHAKTIACVNQFAAYIPVGIFIAVLFGKDVKEDFLKIKKEPVRFVLIVIVAAAVMFIASIAISAIYNILGIYGESDNENIIALMMSSSGIWLMTFNVVILAPIIEEFIFRKMLIDTCEKSFRINPIVAVMISSVIFAFIHVSDCQNFKFIFQYLALAIPLCFTYHLSRNNIFASILVHMINNAIVAISYILVIYGYIQ